MLGIGICNDEEYHINTINVLLTEYCNTRRLAHENCTYTDGIDLINSHKKFNLISYF